MSTQSYNKIVVDSRSYLYDANKKQINTNHYTISDEDNWLLFYNCLSNCRFCSCRNFYFPVKHNI